MTRPNYGQSFLADNRGARAVVPLSPDRKGPHFWGMAGIGEARSVAVEHGTFGFWRLKERK